MDRARPSNDGAGARTPVGFDNVDPPVWAPSVQDVADLSPAYTRGPIDGDTQDSGAVSLSFNSDTDPTGDQVAAIIRSSLQEVIGRVGMGADWLANYADLARRTVAWNAAAMIEAEKAPEGAAEASSAYQWKQSSYVACLKELISQARPLLVR